MDPRLILVSNRLPVTVRVKDGRATVRQSVGGLSSGLRAPHERSGGLWVGWPGGLDGLDQDARRDVDRQLEKLRTVPIQLDALEVAVFYERISNAVLWPICHDRIDRLPLRVDGWDVYESVNARYADAVAEHYRPGDVIWVHDYQLLRVPALLRQRIPEARIGFFLHIPFPNPEIFFTLPTRHSLVEGVMGADLVGFQTRRFLGHFRAALRRLFSLEASVESVVPWGGRQVRLGVFPIGVDAADFSRRAETSAVKAKVVEYRAPGQRLLVGVDRLDYTKGIPRRLLAVERLLTVHPEWRERVRLIQVAVPSRDRVDAYRRIRREVDALVGRINGAFATPTWTPIHYIYRSVPSDVLLALYRAADVMLVTPLRDGMNLVAKEFAASRVDEEGVLVLSEFAGAAEELPDALLVNPYDVDGTAEEIHRALTMEGAVRQRRMRALRATVLEHDVHRWSTSILDMLVAGA
ncbi:MAG: bifunctional alpha,alpha-trehalose-phosphate synthase (UDP-forming)/trehalose-phosphatase [Anaerolineae bacterium]|nr:bifunctional alpha,alpha-trehalose-phosphate synthase (UDP-forming)/trehalose-phosphatase [Gemmatimonadaceae bacterium]